MLESWLSVGLLRRGGRSPAAAVRPALAAGALLLLAAVGARSEPARSAGTTEAIDVDTAIRRALEHNLQLAMDARRVKSASLDIEGAASAFATEVRPDSGAGVSSGGDSWQYGLGFTRAFITGTRLSAGGSYRSDTTAPDAGPEVETRTGQVSVQFDQPLLRNFGTLINGEALLRARRSLLTTMRLVETRKVELVLNVLAEYEQICQLERQIQIDVDLLDRAGKLARLTRAREAQGRATRVDGLRVELQQGEAEARVTSSRLRLDDARRNFAELLGDPPAKVYRLAPPPGVSFDPPPLAGALSVALSNRLDYADALQRREDSLRGVRIAERQRLPDVGLVGRASKPFTSTSDDPDAYDPSWFVGLATGSGYNPEAARVAIAGARLGVDDADDLVRIVRRDIEREVRQQLAAVESRRSEAAIEARNAQMAQGRATLARRLFEAGRGDSFAVTDAEADLSAASLRQLDSEGRARLAVYQFMGSVGTLLEAPPRLKPAASVENVTP